MFNFDKIMIKYYKDMTVALEAFKAENMIIFMKTIQKDGQEIMKGLIL